jgi:hypothetical protein
VLTRERGGSGALDVAFGDDNATNAFIGTAGDERMWFLLNSRESAGDRLRFCATQPSATGT